jgi:hypothetical protein
VVQGSKKYKVKNFFRGKGEKGLEEKLQENSMNWPKNG